MIATTQKAAMSGPPCFAENGRFENPCASSRYDGDQCDYHVLAPTSRSPASRRRAHRPYASSSPPAANPICLDVVSGQGPFRHGRARSQLRCVQTEGSARPILYPKEDTVSLQANELPANCSGNLQRGCNHLACRGDRDRRGGCDEVRRPDVGLQDGASCR